MSEILRVTAMGGIFIYQTYAASQEMTETEVGITRTLLKHCGFEDTDVPRRGEVEEMFSYAGFRITSNQSLHRIYARDNRRMLRKFRCAEKRLRKLFPSQHINALANLLEWEEVLFAKNLWTGLLITVEKPERR